MIEDDVVVLTGSGRILGFGRVGLATTNAALGDALWPHRHPTQGSYRHLYSLAPFVPADLPLTGLRDAGVKWFQTPRYFDYARADTIFATFSTEIPPAVDTPALSPVEREMQEVQEYEAADDAVARDLSWVHELEIEVLSVGAVPVRARTSSVMHRGENLSVHAYVASLHPVARRRRYMTSAGVTDADAFLDGRHELVEAKSSAGRIHVRQALAQLLDYAPALGDRKPHSLAALFPSRPDDSAIDLLHRYGVTCIYRTARGSFERLEAPGSAGQAIARLW